MTIHPTLPAELYHSSAAVNKSKLWKLHTRTPAHTQVDEEQTDAMRFGSAVHTALLEPHLLERQYARLPDSFDGRTKAGKDMVAQADQAGLIAMKAAEYDSVLAIRDKLHAEPLIQKALAGAQFEHSAYWTDAETGIECRCRPDAYNPALGIMLDLKTTQDASLSGFAKAIANYGYHMQQAWYRDGWELAGGGNVDAFVFIAVEKTAPYAYAIYELNPTDEMYGRELYRQALNRYAECKQQGIWPGYQPGVQGISLPGWAKQGMTTDNFA